MSPNSRQQLYRIGFVFLAVFLVPACGASVHSQTREDYAQIDQNLVKHLAMVVVTSPPEQKQMWTLLTRRYVNQHRNFIIRPVNLPDEPTAGTACQGREGVLEIATLMRPKGADVAVVLAAKITRCRDGELVWSGGVDGAWESDDETVAELRAHYAAELGDAVQKWVGPAFMALKALVATMPQPTLIDAEEMEKIELGE